MCFSTTMIVGYICFFWANMPSAAAHCGRGEDLLLSPVQMPWPVPDWSAYLAAEDAGEAATIRRRRTTGRPCGSGPFIEQLELALSRRLRPKKRDPKPGKSPKEK